MKVPLSWLKEYVPITVAPEDLAHRLTMAGLEVAAIQRIGGEWDRDKVFVGLVTSVDPHPNADRLTLATVDLDGETWTVVCGAPNVAVGQKVPFAKEGTRLIDPRSGKLETLKAARIRGVESRGMVCSERELGLGDDHTGIVVLPEDAPVGTPLADYLGDVVFDIEVTANRPDCLSVLGIAHEVAALTGQEVTEPDLSYPEDGEPIEGQVHIEVQDPELCPRYTASLVTGITIGPSPQWLQERLLRAGQRPINNVVDITNYVMLEYGQPLHAFEHQALRDRTIIVRAAREGEVLVTLDGEEHPLHPPMLVIADSKDPVGLAGIMGGANSEMTEATTAVLLESANFHPINNRRTAQALRMRTEATARFEKGLGPGLAPRGLRRATRLILELAGGKAAKGIVDLYPGQREEPPRTLSLDRVKQVLGTEFPLEQMERVFTSLGFECQRQGERALKITVPYWRTDIHLEEDLIEEVARIIGYEHIPTTSLSSPLPQRQPQPRRDLQERIKDLLAAWGMQEVISYSLTSGELLRKVQALEGSQPLKVANPMTTEQEYLRTTLRGSLLATLAANLRRSPEEGLRLFEIGRVYLPRNRDLPHERDVAIGVVAGPRERASWLSPEAPGMDFFDAKGILETLLGQLGVTATFQPSEDALLIPGRCANILAGKARLGVVGEVHPRILERFDISVAPVALFELDLDALLGALPLVGLHYASIPRLPGALRDIAVVVDWEVPADRVRQLIERHRLVTRATLFDVYEGEHIPAAKRSLAYRILFQAPERTLASEEVNQARDDIVKSLERTLGASLRG